jgi:hypothetical protein
MVHAAWNACGQAAGQGRLNLRPRLEFLAQVDRSGCELSRPAGRVQWSGRLHVGAGRVT